MKYNLLGKQFGRLIVIKYDETKEFSWVCKCACGAIKSIKTRNLVGGTTKSCGCLRIELNRTHRKGKQPPNRLPTGRAMRNAILALYQKRAKKFKYEWGLSEEQFDALTKNDCHYCGRSPFTVALAVKRKNSVPNGSFIYNGIDRKDNDLGYVPDNVVTACKICNRAKKDMSYEEFIDYLKGVGRYQLEVELCKV